MINGKFDLKIFLALFIASQSAFAGTMGPVCVPGSVTVPCEQNGWLVGAEALLLKPSYSIGSFTTTQYTR